MKYTVEVTKTRTSWFKEGTFILHRENGPAIENTNGSKEWYIDGKRHREDGPAVELPDIDQWFINGIRHREDGPAVVYKNGNTNMPQWYINGVAMSEEQFKNRNVLKDKIVEIEGKKYKLVEL